VKLSSVGAFVDLYAPLSKINVHIRGGFIIPMQSPGDNLALGRNNPFTLLVALSEQGNATGNLFWDDGDTIGLFSICSINNQRTRLIIQIRSKAMRIIILNSL
jgi:alpha-glucosidase (family GH31 glycosyl hydrolase)